MSVFLLALSLVVLAVVAGRLVVERRRRLDAEATTRRQLASIAHMGRLSAIGELTASLTHELHQPLGAILRSSEAGRMLLASGRASVTELQEILEDIRKDDKRAAEIISRMKTLLRKHELKSERVDVNDVVRETVTFLEPTARSKHVRLETDLRSAAAVVAGDRIHLQQVLLNLVLNSFDAMKRTPADARRIIVAAAATNGHVDVSVRDHGAGIPHEFIAGIFEPFVTTKEDGMGMGLSIARSIVEAHRGRIAAENNADGGATVRFTLPAVHRL